MAVAALYDIHGNLPALEAVLQDCRQAQVDRVVVGGDVVPGPMPRETLARLLSLNVPVQFIYGNGEVAVLAHRKGTNLATLPPPAREPVRWSAEQLSAEDEHVLASWPKTLRLEISGLGPVLFCHATPHDENECFTRLTPEDRLLPIFEGLDVSVVVCGHTHMQFDRTVGRVRVINAGSVGMPFGQPGADWLLLGPGIQLRHTPYNLEQAAQRIGQTRYPQAQEFAAQFVLRPPAEQAMLEVFARADRELLQQRTGAGGQ
jgi:putative phosphoesterase